MKRIIKGEEPREFSTWENQTNDEWQANWDDFAGEVKQTVHHALLKEQGCICCYCNRRISDNNSHIEHLQPQSSSPPELALDYRNLLASCQRDLERREPRHCGTLKKNWYDENLMISPLQEACESRFRFTADGEIHPANGDDIAASTTILKLGLDIKKLTALRRGAIEGILDNIEDLNDLEFQTLIDGFQQKDSQGRFAEFCMAVIYVLRNEISFSQSSGNKSL